MLKNLSKYFLSLSLAICVLTLPMMTNNCSAKTLQHNILHKNSAQKTPAFQQPENLLRSIFSKT